MANNLKFLDQSGVSTLWSRALSKLGDESNGLKALITAEETRAKAAEKANADAILANTALINQILGIEDTDAADLNSIKDLVVWIEDHGEDAAALTTAINELEAYVGTIPESATSANVIDYINEVINALKTGEIKTLTDKVAALEAYDHAADLQAAKDYADGLAGNYDANGSAAQALSDAKAYTDETVASIKNGETINDFASVETALENLENGLAIALTTEEIDAAIAAATPEVE